MQKNALHFVYLQINLFSQKTEMISYLQLENVTKSYGEVSLFEDISLGIGKDQKVALIAKNGTGKTSLLKIAAGKDTADSGQVAKRNGITIGYLEQLPELDPQKTVLQQVFISSNKVIAAIEEYEAALLSHDKVLLQKAFEQMDTLQAWDFEVKVKQILSQLKIFNFNQYISELSGGQQKRVALANVLINEPDLLILDEPTNHLDLQMIEWLEAYLKKTKSTLLMVTHDRYFLDRVCNEIVELDNKILYTYKGNYSYYLEKREERLYNTMATIEKATSIMKKELEWVRRMPKARGTKAKYRLDNFENLKKTASQKIESRQLNLDIQTRRLGKKVLELYNISKSFDNLKLIEDFSYKFAAGEKVGIVGNNGSGKSTFLNLITEKLPMSSGRMEVGKTVVFGYYEQSGITLKDDMRIIDVIKEETEVITIGKGKKMAPKQFLEYFLFPPTMHYQRVEKLSGGEKRRLYLMMVLLQNPNFLILDEPTNDLDILTLNVLEEYLQSFSGCVIIVSHDRYFMDKVVDHLFVFEGNGAINDFPGNYSEYREYLDFKEEERKAQTKDIQKDNVALEVKPKNVKKFKFKDKQEYEQIEKDLALLELEKQNIELLMNEGNLSANILVEKSERLGKILEEIDEKEMRWLELNEIKESD